MFIVLALPRSRTYWLSKFLSYGDYECGHEEARHLRSIEDARIWLNRSYAGSAETSISPWWRLIQKFRPDVRIVTVRRPVDQVVDSLMRLDMGDVGSFDRDVISKAVLRLDAKLDQIERRMPNVLSVQYEDLSSEDVCASVFERCLPYRHDHEWWSALAPVNMQINMRSMMRYMAAYRQPLDTLIATAKHRSIADMVVRRPMDRDGVTFQQETFSDWERDGVKLFEEHCVDVGEHPDQWKTKNIPVMKKLYEAGLMQITTARCNGRMFGYLAAFLHPSLESRTMLTAVHTTFFVSKELPGLGLRLQRASAAALRQSGAGEIFLRQGIRGSGPKMGALYRRMGAQFDGELYRLQLEGI